MTSLLSPRWWVGHLALLIALVVSGLLGWWQVEAWQSHRELAARDLTNSAPLALIDVMGPDDRFPGTAVGQPVTVTGDWLDAQTVLVEGRPHGGKMGYWVVTPLHVAGTESAVPVIRGWSATPQPPAIAGRATVEGWLEPGGGSGPPDPDPTDRVITSPRLASLHQMVDRDLFEAFVISKTSEPGLKRVEPAATNVTWSTGLRNLLYALQWVVFGGLAVLMWWRSVRDALNPEADLTEEEAEQPALHGSGG